MSGQQSDQAYNALRAGDSAPWFRQRTSSNPRFAFDTVAGRYIVFCFFGSAADPQARGALSFVRDNRGHFDDTRACFFGVSLDPTDETAGRVRDAMPGVRFFFDHDGSVSRAYGSIPSKAEGGDQRSPIRRFWMVIDPTLRVLAVVPFASDGSDRAAVFGYLARLPPPSLFAGQELQAPVLFLPNVFEADFCRHLIALYGKAGGHASGFMREIGGRTVLVHDHAHKVRRDHTLTDPDVIKAVRARIKHRIVPEIRKVHQFHANRMERYLIGCYDAEESAHFAPHRDNTTKGTAHRRFAVSINLNDDFDGGEVGFPEYGPRSFKAGTGGAVVFSCSLLHTVSKVTRGRRYAFLPFLYDDAAALIREANLEFIGAEGGDAGLDQRPASSSTSTENPA